MSVLQPADSQQLSARLGHHDAWLVVCLCAEWCGTCREFRTAFDALAVRFPDTCFVRIDIEDEADLVGDLDIEDFPTILVQRGGQVLFFGTMLPRIGVLERQLSELRQSPLRAVPGPDLRARLLAAAA